MELQPSRNSSLDKHHDLEEHVENPPGPALSKHQQRRMWLRIDLKIVPMMSIILAISIIDRINIGNAKVLGMQQDLDLDIGSRYSVVLLLFFPGYFISELPSNMMLAKFGVKVWMSILTFGFGLCVLCMGFVPNWQVLAFLRFMLGLFEGGIYPACVFLLSSWYPRYMLHSRLSALYAVGVMASAFGGILAYGLSQMSGLRGMLGWRWVFIIEGTITMVASLITYFFVGDFPDKATFLTPDEKNYVFATLRNDSGDASTERLTWEAFKNHSQDPFVWISTIMFMCIVVPTYGLAFFVPSILVGLGYSGVQATLHSAPPYAAAVGMLLVTAYIGDRLRQRGLIVIFLASVTLCGMILVRPSYSNEVRYLGIFLAVMGAAGNQTALLSFAQNNIVGSSKRLFVSALNIAGGAIGGIIGSTAFRSQDAPFYNPVIYTVIALQVLLIVLMVGTLATFWRINRRADQRGEEINLSGWRHTL